MPRTRPRTDQYLAAIRQAIDRPGVWIDVRTYDEVHGSEGGRYNANKTAECLRGGFLRVRPRDDERVVHVQGKRYLATDGPVEARVVDDRPRGWTLKIRFPA